MEENKVLTIVFTDIKGFTERTSHSDRGEISDLLKKHEELLLPIAKSYNGTLIKTIGDALLLSFTSPTNAVLCSIMMQEKLKTFNIDLPNQEKIEIRIAMNTGEVLLRDGDIFGEPVNIAARIEGLAEANEIWFSESTYLAMNKKEVPTSLIGEYRLKGIPEAVKIYRVVRDEQNEAYINTIKNQKNVVSSLNITKRSNTSKRNSISFLYVLTAFAIAIVAFFLIREPPFDKSMRLANEAMQKADYRTAISEYKKAVELNPTDEKAIKLYTNTSMKSHIDSKLRVEGEKIEVVMSLEKFVKDTKLKFPHTDFGLMPSEIRVLLLKANLFAISGKRKNADQILDDLAEKRPNDDALLFKIAKFYDHYGYNWTRSIDYLTKVLKLKPHKYASETVTLSQIDYFLNKVLPSEGYDDLRYIISQNFYDIYKEKLEKALYASGKEFHVLRRNASIILSANDIKVDKTKLYLVDLFTSHGSISSKEFRETMEYLPSVKESMHLYETIASLPKQLDVLEDYYFYDKNDLFPLFAGILFNHLRDYLIELLSSDKINARINSFNILMFKNEITDEQRWIYSAKNICEFKMYQWSASYYPSLVDSLEFLVNHKVPVCTNNKSMLQLTKKLEIAINAIIVQEKKAMETDKALRFLIPEIMTEEKLIKLIKKLHIK